MCLCTYKFILFNVYICLGYRSTRCQSDVGSTFICQLSQYHDSSTSTYLNVKTRLFKSVLLICGSPLQGTHIALPLHHDKLVETLTEHDLYNPTKCHKHRHWIKLITARINVKHSYSVFFVLLTLQAFSWHGLCCQSILWRLFISYSVFFVLLTLQAFSWHGLCCQSILWRLFISNRYHKYNTYRP